MILRPAGLELLAPRRR